MAQCPPPTSNSPCMTKTIPQPTHSSLSVTPASEKPSGLYPSKPPSFALGVCPTGLSAMSLNDLVVKDIEAPPAADADPSPLPSPTLDKMAISGRKATRKARRGFHRLMSGMSLCGEYRLLTLTSSPDAPADIERSWQCLIKRLKRRGVVVGYCKVVEHTQAGRHHIHAVVRGSYVACRHLSQAWEEIHKSPIIDIRAITRRGRGYQKAAAYLSKYLVKDNGHRLCPSFDWLYPGACRVWRALVYATCRFQELHLGERPWKSVLRLWHLHLAQRAKLLQLLIATGQFELAYFYRLRLQAGARGPRGLVGGGGKVPASLPTAAVQD